MKKFVLLAALITFSIAAPVTPTYAQGEQQRRLEEVEERTKPTIDCRSAARARAAEIAQYQYSSDLIPGDPTERQIDDDHIELVAKDFKFQNGFGAWRYVPYRCIYNTRTKTVESVLFEE